MSGENDPLIGSYVFVAPPGYEHEMIEVTRTGKVIDGVFVYDVDVWKITKLSWCLGRKGEWTIEPLPSARDAEFFAEYRWTLQEAMTAVHELRGNA